MVAAVLLVAGCHKSDGGTPGQPDEKLVRVALPARPVQLDPAVATDPGALALMPDLYQTLLTIPPDQNTPAPDAADCQFDTPTTYRCTVRTGLTFANGHELDASDVEHSIERLRTVPGASRAAALFGSVERVEATRDDTVVFALRRPDATLPYALTTPAASIVDQDSYPPDRVVPPTEAVGSGPYKLGRFASTVVLEKFDKYKGTPRPANTKVEISFPGDVTALAKAVGSGAADLAGGLPGGYQPGGTLQTASTATQRIGSWAFRSRSTVARQPAVRRAAAQLLDRETLVRRVYGERVRPLASLVPDGYEGHTDAFSTAYGTADRTKAASLLRTAGIKTPVRLTIGWTSGSGQKEAEEIRRQLQTGGLFAVTINRTASADLVQQGLTAAVPDADGFLRPALRPYPSPVVTKLLDQEITAQSRSDRMTALTSLQSQSAVDAWVLPVWQELSAVLARAEVDGADRVLDRLSALRLAYLSVN